MKTLSKSELRMKLTAWVKQANEKGNELLKIKNEASLKAYDCNINILRSFITVFVRSLSPEEASLADERTKHLNDVYDFEKLRGLPSYNSLNPLAVLRIYHRKLSKLSSGFHIAKEPLRQLMRELKEIDLSARKHPEYLIDFEPSITVYRESIKELLDQGLDSNNLDYWEFVEVLFSSGRTVRRDDLLQVITIDKSRKHWDGSLIKPYAKRVAGIPEEIDFNTFKDLILKKRIEADYDDYLHDSWMIHFFKVKEEYERQTGEKAIDPFQVLEDITGKPVQTFTAEVDEYGDIVNLTPNKPNLKVVNGNAND
ncbi:hypothetical protein [Paenibacillus alvei]|uniref:Uncharacterized protein n=1 Tax=Paenibacillus alvei TaxID=44250 RepID=A0AAP7A0Y9_PAEAL|nr:hypothetical protein [Paenibacillus alvei]NOJ72449.1 hypothetical protein [Paenibacillus alvei]